MFEIPAAPSGFSLPPNFPQTAPNPKFAVGDRVQWSPQPTQDFGTVIGFHYAPDSHFNWAWKYVIWLDSQSSSRSWTVTDIAWETDLEFMIAPTGNQDQEK